MLCKGNAPVRADERRLNWQRTLTQTLHAAERYSETSMTNTRNMTKKNMTKKRNHLFRNCWS